MEHYSQGLMLLNPDVTGLCPRAVDIVRSRARAMLAVAELASSTIDPETTRGIINLMVEALYDR